MKSDLRNKNNRIYWYDFILSFILFAFPFLHVSTGVAITDTTYNLGNYVNFPNFNRTWMISTIFANIVGKLGTLLPGGHKMLFMCIYTTAISGIISVLLYFMARQLFSTVPSFFAMMIAIMFCWCPREILYHYLTYLLFDVAAFVLIAALLYEKKKLFIIAGVILAFNTFVRFPNITETALIVVVFAYGVIFKTNIVKEVLLCVAGYCITFLGGVILIDAIFGKKSYITMIFNLFGMTKQATSYKPMAMITKMVEDYLNDIDWFIPIAIAAILTCVIYGFVKNGILRLCLLTIESLVILLVARYMHYFGVFTTDYTIYSSIYVWGEFIVFISVIVSAFALFSRKVEKKYKLMAVVVPVILLITPIGSNNGFYSSLNNMFIPLIFSLGIIDNQNVIGELKQEILKSGKAKVFGRFSLHKTPIGVAFILILCACMIQGIGFSTKFVFRDAPFMSKENIKISDDNVLRGMHTRESNAENIILLKKFICEKQYENDEVILFGNIPGIAYCLDLKPAISHTWADLDSYPYEEMRDDMKKIKGKPLIIVNIYYEKIDEDAQNNPKAQLINDFIQNNNYEAIYKNSEYVVFASKR